MSAMAARDSELKSAPTTETAPEVAPTEPAAANTAFSSEGDLPAVAKTGAVAAPVSASDQAFGKPGADQKANHELDSGIHVNAYRYKAACESAGKPEKWKDHYVNGHTEAKGWEQPYERRRTFDWELKKGTSASQAIQDFIQGPTIADYRIAGVADDLDELRSEFGDHKFDRLFGSANRNDDNKIPEGQRLKINPGLYSIPLIDQMKEIARKSEMAERPQEEEKPAPAQEARVEEKPKAEEMEPVVVAQELGLEQADREMV
jgi:hypothetical protein